MPQCYCMHLIPPNEDLQDCIESPWQGTESLEVHHHSWALLPVIGTPALLHRLCSDLGWDKLCSWEAGAQCIHMPPAPSWPAPSQSAEHLDSFKLLWLEYYIYSYGHISCLI